MGNRRFDQGDIRLADDDKGVAVKLLVESFYMVAQTETVDDVAHGDLLVLLIPLLLSLLQDACGPFGGFAGGIVAAVQVDRLAFGAGELAGKVLAACGLGGQFIFFVDKLDLLG